MGVLKTLATEEVKPVASGRRTTVEAVFCTEKDGNADCLRCRLCLAGL